MEIIVVDNDASGGAHDVVAAFRKTSPACGVVYEVQPEKNISLTRNRSVQLASGDWIALVDDDERAPRDWLERLADSVERFAADGVLGPVIPLVPEDAPAWIRRGRFYDFPRTDTGTVVAVNRLRLGNAMLRASYFREQQLMFDPAFGLTGGEDNDLLARMVQAGARIVWDDDAVVHEPIEASRLSLRWLVLRAMRGGQDLTRNAFAGRYGRMNAVRRAMFLSRAFAQAGIALVLIPLSWPLGRHHAAAWLIKAAANMGKLSAVAGFAYKEYA